MGMDASRWNEIGEFTSGSLIELTDSIIVTQITPNSTEQNLIDDLFLSLWILGLLEVECG